jgi:protein-S-isoprenylcysteine O-methyltransferase Ste14
MILPLALALVTFHFAPTIQAFGPVLSTPHLQQRNNARLTRGQLQVRIPLYKEDNDEDEYDNEEPTQDNNFLGLEVPSNIMEFKSPSFMENFQLPDFSGFSLERDFGNFDVSQVVENLFPSNAQLGERGEVYFGLQVALILSILLGGIPFLGGTLMAILGPASLLGGLITAGLSVVDLGSDSLSPFPATTSTSSLKTSGIYQEMRHPMYSGLLLTMFGLALLTNSADRMLLTGALFLLLDKKVEKEEEFLTQSFPEEYSAYQQQVPEKFIPKTFLEQLPWN